MGAHMSEWTAFGIVAVICGLLAALVRSVGNEEPQPPEPPTDLLSLVARHEDHPTDFHEDHTSVVGEKPAVTVAAA